MGLQRSLWSQDNASRHTKKTDYGRAVSQDMQGLESAVHNPVLTCHFLLCDFKNLFNLCLTLLICNMTSIFISKAGREG